MKRITLLIAFVAMATTSLASEPAPAEEKSPVSIIQEKIADVADAVIGETETVHWGYSGAGAPKFWGSLKPEYQTCSEGVNQSPIDIRNTIEADLPPIAFNYPTAGQSILNNGHSIQVNMEPGSSILIDGVTFELKQFHFHTPSENTINGVSYPMEVHLVHSDSDGNLAVIGVMIEAGGWNTVLDRAWRQMPQTEGEPIALTSRFTANGLLPGNQDYYRYNGSLTTPPCTEGVRWIVMKKPIMASQQQIDQFTQQMGGPTNRPVQPVHARPVLH